jgi:hypothetical protein
MNEPRCVLKRNSYSASIQEEHKSLRLTIDREGESTHVQLSFGDARILAYELLASAVRAEMAFNSAILEEMKKIPRGSQQPL